MSWIFGIVIALAAFLLAHKEVLKWICILAKTLPRDFRWLFLYVRMTQWAKKCAQNNYTVPQMFTTFVKKHPQKVALYFEDKTWTYNQVQEFSNKIANYFKCQGFKKGDTIALLLDNCAAYPAIWLGLSKQGIVTALINTNLIKGPLVHCIQAANCKALIFGSSHIKAIRYVTENMQSIKLYQFGDQRNEEDSIKSNNLKEELKNVSEKYNLAEADIQHKDAILYIYTSGTTGLPKAALLSHARLMLAVKTYSRIAKMVSTDKIYTPLPLYHSAGGIVGVCQAFVTGIPVVIRGKFSATNYFKDCAKYNVTIGQYVGEMCRYLLANPDVKSENHQLRVLLGNGLRPIIWKQFVGRFRIKQVIEFYGASEGIANMSNTDGTIGAVGFIPRYLKWAFAITNIRCNHSTGEPFRNENGRCIECKVDEPGLLVAKINLSKTMFNFEGYTDKEASEKRLLRNVFRDGDLYFSSGDILAYDELGYFYFKDRSGDTFRWKSENVSTAEIEAMISKTIDLNDVSVYGIKVPHTEGRAGMAAIVDPNNDLDMEEFGKTLTLILPKYAIPIFLRIMQSLPITGTFKLKKTDLREEGFDIEKIKDKMYFYDTQYGWYVPLTREIYDEIQSGNLRI